MTEYIRQLDKSDYYLYKKIKTNLKEDYILKIFNQLTEQPHTLFGLFKDDMLVAIAGYTVYAQNYAMIGRFRTDSRFQGKGYGTKVLSHALEQAKRHPNIKWIGGNTERHNKPALSVLKKLGLPPVITLFPSQTSDVFSLTTGEKRWTEITNLDRKKMWVNHTYLDSNFKANIFPYKAYYPFPAESSLFSHWLNTVQFFENQDHNRYLIIWKETADKDYLHIVYPWSDFMNQPGFFETLDYNLKTIRSENRILWVDLTKEEVETLPSGHPFRLPSPWILHGMYTNRKHEPRLL